ncbi:MAG TPA: cell division protein ZapE, partial [Xanthomonadaceae bacterium]|nr:cell division protein ZapE [Xanthomonadaceae bacterium]
MADARQGPTPGEVYAAGVTRGDWQRDPAQLPTLAELERIHHALAEASGPGFFGRLLGKREAAPKGLYLWGGVGRGKTFLVDLFYDNLKIPSKRRTHFHRFMREVHAQLRAHAGERDPLGAIARQWGRELRVLVLDEFFVSDIGDAMLLARLLDGLFAEGVVLVTTSNTPPDRLYAGGLQRARFLPAIELLKRHCVVLELDSSTDYRLRALTKSPVYRAPLDAGSGDWLQQRWDQLTSGVPLEDGPLVIEGREIPARALAEGHAWFDFEALCEGPRATADY